MSKEKLEELYQSLANKPSDMKHHMPRLGTLGKDQTVTEIGFRTGVSACSFLRGGCKQLHSIEISEKCQPHEVLASDPRFTLHYGNSHEMEPWETDVLFIDGDHTYEGVMADLERWEPKTKRLIAMHDTNAKKHPGVYRAMGSFFLHSKVWQMVQFYRDSHGLAVWERADV